MSYKSIVLSDFPLSYHPLDDFSTSSISSYTDLLSQYPTYQDLTNSYPSYSNMTSPTAYDYSGCGNNATYFGIPVPNLVPIVAGNSMSTRIQSDVHIQYNLDNDYTATAYTDHFGTKYSSDADFTIECWIYPRISSTSAVPLVADSTNNIGLFYENGNISFGLDSKTLTHTLLESDKVIHVVAVYAVTAAYLYIDGELVSYIDLPAFEFTNTECNLQSGPTLLTDTFHINSVATYRYALSQQRVMAHYNESVEIPPIQASTPENSELFQLSDNSPTVMFKYSYPGNKGWDYFATEDLNYNQNKNTLSLVYNSAGGSKTVTIEDYVSLPSSSILDSSKIEWTASQGVEVWVSVDNATFTKCVNGGPVPYFEMAEFIQTNDLYINIIMNTTDLSKYIPTIKDLSIVFYNTPIWYSKNGGSYIETLKTDVNSVVYDLAVGNKYYPVLQRKSTSGIKAVANSGFYINTNKNIRSMEFFYTPSSLAAEGGLIETESGDIYKWNNSGLITKTGILEIFVNGIAKTTETHIGDVFRENELHHVILVVGTSATGLIKFNNTIYGSESAKYENICLYDYGVSGSQVSTDLYDIYRYKSYKTYNASTTSSMMMTENSVNYYNNDWKVIQSS